MGIMKISARPYYRKTGSPTVKKRREEQQVSDLLFAELLPYTSRKIRAKSATTTQEKEP
jgi:hypothetical protein